MNRILDEEIINEIIKNETRTGWSESDPCCHFLLESPWPAWAQEMARRSPDEALALLGSGWGGLAPGHAEKHLRHLGLNCSEGASGEAGNRWKRRPDAFVIRGRGLNGSGSSWLPVEFLAPGDILLLSEGDAVPADMRLLRVHDFRVDEAAITGDPRPVSKTAEWAGSPERTDPVDIPDLCFCGSRVVGGTATAMVVATGKRTLAAMLRAS